MKLRPYQTDLIDKTRALMTEGERSVLIVAPTGAGKTCTVAHMLKSATSKGKKAWFTVHRRELLHQASETFKTVGVDHGIISPDHEFDPSKKIQIASIQSVSRRLKTLKKPDIIIWDEVAHIPSASWAKIYEEMKDIFHVGVTACPWRLSGEGLRKWFPKMVLGPPIHELMEQGFLSRYKIYAPKSGIDTEGLHTRMGDFVTGELENVVDRPTITGNTIQQYNKYLENKRAIIFCASIKHSKHVVEAFESNGIPSAHVDGDTPRQERDLSIKKFKDDKLKIISSVEIFSEGFDCPGAEGVIFLRPTQSLSLYLQQAGRGLRPFPGKEIAIMIDQAGNCLRHGLPDDVREWTLEDRERNVRPSNNGAPVRICERCLAAQPANSHECRYCGFIFPIKSRKVEEVDGELQEMQKDQMRREIKREQGMANSFQDLIILGKRRGYKNPWGWAHCVFNARQRKKLGRVKR